MDNIELDFIFVFICFRFSRTKKQIILNKTGDYKIGRVVNPPLLFSALYSLITVARHTHRHILVDAAGKSVGCCAAALFGRGGFLAVRVGGGDIDKKVDRVAGSAFLEHPDRVAAWRAAQGPRARARPAGVLEFGDLDVRFKAAVESQADTTRQREHHHPDRSRDHQVSPFFTQRKHAHPQCGQQHDHRQPGVLLPVM